MKVVKSFVHFKETKEILNLKLLKAAVVVTLYNLAAISVLEAQTMAFFKTKC